MSSFSLILEVDKMYLKMYLKTVDTIRYDWIEWDYERSGFHWKADYIGSGFGS